jgi:hypothetical protein
MLARYSWLGAAEVLYLAVGFTLKLFFLLQYQRSELILFPVKS